MKNRAVGLGVKPCLRIECKFWLGDDGWNGGVSTRPSLFNQAASKGRSPICKSY